MLANDWLTRLKDHRRSRAQARRPRRDRDRDRGGVARGWAGDWLLEERCLLAGLLMPSDTVPPESDVSGAVKGISAVLYDGGLVKPTAATQKYVKQITITNNSPETIYPFLEDANNRTATPGDPAPAPTYTGTGMFDPFDPLNHEYRGYIGYTAVENGQTVTYMGLQSGQAITINVPLAFWDAGRIIITTDGADLLGQGGNGNPFLYRDQSMQATYYGSVSGNTLTFTPVYNSFAYNSANNDYEPSTANWQPPANLTSGMAVNGPGIPANTTITVGNDPYAITLNPPQGSSITTAAGVQQFTFTSTTPISPSLRYTQKGYTITDGSGSDTNGAVMWYHSLTAENPNNDAPFQLIEMSFRGTFYDPKINVGTGFNYLIGFDTSQKNYISANDFDLVNYDVSYVDAIALPVALQADHVPIPNTALSQPFGWVGASLKVKELQDAFTDFTGGNSSLGSYFGGQGYPRYYAPPSVDIIKLPSGQNLFFQSPLNTGSNLSSFSIDKTFPPEPPAGASSLNLPLFALTDGGTGPFSLGSGGDQDPNIPSPTPTQLVLHHSTGADKYVLQLMDQAINVEGEQFALVAVDGSPIAEAILVTSMLKDPVTQQLVGVNLERSPNVSNPTQRTYTFNRPVKDPIAQAIASVWYSWASYYATTVESKAKPVLKVSGSIDVDPNLPSNVLVLNNATLGLVPGMAVTDAQGNPHGVITAVGLDNKTITLDQVPSGAFTDTFNFAVPSVNSLVGYDPTGLTPIQNFDFTNEDPSFVAAFAQNVYLVMSTMGRTVKPGTTNAAIPLLGNIIGGNVGPSFLPSQNASIQSTITNQIKSALRGVPDFTSPAYANPSLWYPDPALKKGGQDYNVYNLDPFIWFIHEKLGLSAYAFGLDDDIGDVGAGGSTKLNVSVGGLNGLSAQNPGVQGPYPFANTANYGPVQATIAQAPTVGSSVITGLPLSVVNSIAGANFANNTPGVLVNGPGVPIGTTVLVFDSVHGSVTLSSPITGPLTGPFTYYFYGPVVGTGTVLGAGQSTRTIQGLDMNTYNTLLNIGPLSNVQVTGPGIDQTSQVTINKLFLQDGVPVVILSKPLDASKISEVGGSFAYTFGYAAFSPVVDAGFEQPPDVSQVVGGFLHGPQLSPPSGDQAWTFTDGDSDNGIYAGIAANNSTYTKLSGPAPQGLQVGFIQGTSSISQVVTLASGSYTLSLLAADSTLNSTQTLDVSVDGTKVGGINPGGTSYAKVSIPFTVVAGAHTIKFQGTTAGKGTILIDSVAIGPPSKAILQTLRRPPRKVEVLAQPEDGTAGKTLAPVLVAAIDRSGSLVRGRTFHAFLIRIGPGSRRRFVRGSLMRARTINGVASFNRLTVRAPGRYVLRVRLGHLRVASAAFDIGPAPPH